MYPDNAASGARRDAEDLARHARQVGLVCKAGVDRSLCERSARGHCLAGALEPTPSEPGCKRCIELGMRERSEA